MLPYKLDLKYTLLFQWPLAIIDSHKDKVSHFSFRVYCRPHRNKLRFHSVDGTAFVTLFRYYVLTGGKVILWSVVGQTQGSVFLPKSLCSKVHL